MIKVRDLIAAEEALESAEAEFRKLSNDVSTWSAYESLDRHGKRVINVPEADFQRREYALGRVQAAHQQLLGTRRAFFAGAVDGGGIDHATT